MPERVLPREFPTPPYYIVPLSNSELKELGTFTAIWSQIDFVLMHLLAHLIRCELGIASLITETMTTGPRVGLIVKLCQRDQTNPTKVAISKLLEANGGLIEDRNHIIHGIWAVEWDCQTGATNPGSHYQRAKNDRRIPASMVFGRKLSKAKGDQR